MAVADRAYASLKLLDRCRSSEKSDHLHHPLRLDAALYEPAPPRRPHQIGRPRLKGERLPNLSVVAEDPNTVWKPTKIANWYGSGERMVEIASQTAVWYSTGLFAVPVRWVLVRDPQGEFKTQALLCTDLDADPEQIVSLVRDALAAGGDLPGGAQASGIRDAEAVVGVSDPKNHTGAVGVVLAGHLVCASAGWCRQAGVFRARRPGTTRLIRPSPMRWRWCARSCGPRKQTFYGSPAADRHGKSPAGICGTTNRCGLLCSLMAKVELGPCLL